MWLFIAILIHIIGPVKSFCSANEKAKGWAAFALLLSPCQASSIKKPHQEKVKGKQTL